MRKLIIEYSLGEQFNTNTIKLGEVWRHVHLDCIFHKEFREVLGCTVCQRETLALYSTLNEIFLQEALCCG